MSTPRPCEVDGCEEDALDRVCGGCRVRFETALRSVPDLETELETTRTRQDRTVPDGPIVTSSPTRPLPWNVRADEASAALWDALAGWYRLIAPELPDAPCGCPAAETGPWCWDAHCWAWQTERILADRVPDPVTSTRLAAWLLGHVGDVLRHPDAPFVISDVLDATTGAERAVDSPPALVYAGTCDYCDADLYGRLGKPSVVCVGRRDEPGCGTRYSAGARRAQLLESLREHTATAAEIAHGVSELAGVKIDRRKLNVWATRIIDTSTDPRPKLPDRRTREEFLAGQAEPDSGRGLERVFRIGEVLDLIAASAVDRQAASDRRREQLPTLEADDWARRMAEGSGLDLTG